MGDALKLLLLISLFVPSGRSSANCGELFDHRGIPLFWLKHELKRLDSVPRPVFDRLPPQDPALRDSIKTAIEILSSKDAWLKYFDELIADSLILAEISQDPKAVILFGGQNSIRFKYAIETLRQRSKIRGEEKIQEIEDFLENSEFAAVAAKGPFVDLVAVGINYGKYTYLMQRDLLYRAASANFEFEKFWAFFGTEEGLFWWSKIFREHSLIMRAADTVFWKINRDEQNY